MAQPTLRRSRAEWEKKSLERRLASDRRAGAWPGSKALRMRYDFIRRAWYLVLLGPAVAAALAPAVLLAPRSLRGFLLGVLAASGVWSAEYITATASGAAPVLMGQLAEQWTARELRRLRRRGWRLINGARFRVADIDHVLLGPGGAVVVETKHRSQGWPPGRYTNQAIAEACQAVRRNAEDIRLTLGKSLLTAPMVRPGVVLWGQTDGQVPRRGDDGVWIVPGPALRAWLAGLPDEGLDQSTVSALYDKLAAHVVRRDSHDHDRQGPPPRTITATVILVVGAVVLGLVGCAAELEVLHQIGWQWVVPVGAGFIAVQWPLRAVQTARPWRFAWLAGSQLVTIAIGVAYVVQLVGHHL